MRRSVCFLLPAMMLLLQGCSAPRAGVEDSWARRASDFVDPLVPDSLRFGPREPALKSALRIDPAEFPLAERRELKAFFTVQNTTGKAERLDFPTAQRIELSVMAPDGKRIFLWSEDRLFESASATVVVNPRERIEYEATIPTRDMTAGATYTAEVVLLGNPDVTATAAIHPR